MSKRRKSVSDDVLPDPSPIEITDSQECIPSNHDEVFKPFDVCEFLHRSYPPISYYTASPVIFKLGRCKIAMSSDPF